MTNLSSKTLSRSKRDKTTVAASDRKVSVQFLLEEKTFFIPDPETMGIKATGLMPDIKY